MLKYKNTLNKEQIIALSSIRKGDRILLVKMEDKQAPLPFTKGTVSIIDDNLTIHMRWDDGTCLGLIPGLDSFYLVPKELTKIETKFKKDPHFQAFFKKHMTDKKLEKWINNLNFIYIGPAMFMLDDIDLKLFSNDLLVGD